MRPRLRNSSIVGVAAFFLTAAVVAQAQPVINSVTPNAFSPGGPAFTLVISGSGLYQCVYVYACFGPTVRLQPLNASPTDIAVPFSPNAKDITVTVPATVIASQDDISISVINGGGTSNTVTVPNRLAINNIMPNSVAAGDPSFTLTVNGIGFFSSVVSGLGFFPGIASAVVSGSTILFNNTPLTTTFVNSTQLTAVVPSNLLVCPGAGITVQNAPRLVSNPMTLTVTCLPPPPPPPMILSVTPQSATAGDGDVTVQIYGTGFQPLSQGLLDGVPLMTTFVSPTQLTVVIRMDLLAQPRLASIGVVNPSPPILRSQIIPSPIFSNKLPFPIRPPLIVSLNPPTVVADGSPLALTVNGSDFLRRSIIYLNNTPLAPTAFVNSTQLTVVVPSNLLVCPGTVDITVQNAPGLFSNSMTLKVTCPPPTISLITLITPGSATACDGDVTVLITGTGFQPRLQALLGNVPLMTTFLSPTQATAVIPMALLRQPGADISVLNPDGQSSNALPFIINPCPVPDITGISPPSTESGGPALTLTLSGTGFIVGSSVTFNGQALTVMSGTTTQIIVVVPAAFLIGPTSCAAIVVSNRNISFSSPVCFVIKSPPDIICGISGSFPQPQLDCGTSRPYPFSIPVLVRLTFQPDNVGQCDDQMIKFAAGGRLMTSAIEPNTTIAFPLQTGTVSGTVRIQVSAQAGGADLVVNDIILPILPSAPVIRSAQKRTLNSTDFEVSITGYATPRGVTNATFHFNPAAGSTVQFADITTDAAPIFSAWYTDQTKDRPSCDFGSQFTYTQTFTVLNGSPALVDSVTVTLTNSSGTSAPRTTPSN